MRSFLCASILFSLCSVSFAAGEGPDLSAKEDGRFQMLAINGRAMLMDRQSGKSWLLAARGEKAAWIPIQRLGDSTIASSWLKANLPARNAASNSSSRGANRNVSMTQAQRQVRLEQITNSEVAAEPFSVLVARQKAELTRLKAEYGDRHPEVLSSRGKLVELLKVGESQKKKK